MSDYKEAVEDIKKALTVLENKPNSDLPIKEVNYPDPKWHLIISLAKSGIRIGAGVFLCAGLLVGAGVLLIAAEVLGIVEELV